jgi:hypothetical protein
MASDSRIITHALFQQITEPLLNLEMRQPRPGVANTLLADFGSLSPVRYVTPKPRKRGQASILIEPSWRIETRKKILVGSDSDEPRVKRILKQLENARITEVRVEGDLPELVLEFEDKWILRSFGAMETRPHWALFFRDESLFPKPVATSKGFDHWIKSDRGKLVWEWACGRNPFTTRD